MDTTEIVLQILYTLVVAIAAFGFRGKWPDNYYIGCSLCLFAPAWGQLYKKSKYAILTWIMFMAIERGVMKSVDDLSSFLVSWLVVGCISAGVMYYRISSTKQSEPTNRENPDSKIVIDPSLSLYSEQNISSEKQLSDSTHHKLSKVEIGVSRIGVILGCCASLILAFSFIIEGHSFILQTHKILTVFIDASASICLGMFVWGFTVVFYRILLWIKFGFSSPDMFSFKKVIIINSKLLFSVFVVFLAGIILQYIYLNNLDKQLDTAMHAPISYTDIQSTSSCSEVLEHADNVRLKMQRHLKIYGKYPSDLEDLWSKFPNNINQINLVGTNVFNKTHIATHITMLNRTRYSISFTENRCNQLYRIESKQDKVLYEDL